MSILNNLNKKPLKGNAGLNTAIKVGGGIGVAGGLYAAGEFSKNTDRLHNDFGHVGSVFHKLDENTAVSSSVPMSYLGDKPYPMLTSKSLETVKKIVRRK